MSATGKAGGAISRRELLRLTGGALGAAGLFAAARFAPPLVGGDERHLASLPSLAHAPTLDSKANISVSTTPTGQVLRFQSRPDLQLAVPQVYTDLPGQDPGLILTDTHAGPGGQGPLILDSQGQQPVWFKQISLHADPSKRAFNLRLGRYKQQPVLSWFEGAVVNEHGEGHYMIVDSSYSTVTTVHAGNGYIGDLHEFFLTPQGTAYFTCFGLGYADLRPYGGSAHGAFYYGVAQEVDVSSGKVLFQWRSDQHVAFDDSYTTPKQFGTEPWDYFHINAISLDGNGDLLICSRNTSAIYKVSRSTGEVLYRIGGKQSDFSFAPGAQFAWQHDATAQPDGTITVFDNGAGVEVTQPQSRALVLRLDMSSKTVELVQAYPHPGGAILANALGSVQLLEGGHTFIGWGNRGWFSEIGQNAQALLNGRLAGDTTLSYRAFRSAWVATPQAPPDIAVQPGASTTALYASWNGATEVDRWAVLGGSDKDHLSALGVAPKAGFETEITVPGRPAHVRVAALDALGRHLGLSGTLKTGPN